MKNNYFSDTTWNFKKWFENTGVKTSNIIIKNIGSSDWIYIYKYMVQNILKISHVFGQKIVLCYNDLNCGIREGEDTTKNETIKP